MALVSLVKVRLKTHFARSDHKCDLRKMNIQVMFDIRTAVDFVWPLTTLVILNARGGVLSRYSVVSSRTHWDIRWITFHICSLSEVGLWSTQFLDLLRETKLVHIDDRTHILSPGEYVHHYNNKNELCIILFPFSYDEIKKTYWELISEN